MPKVYHDNNKSVGCWLWSNMGTCRSAKQKINCQFVSWHVIKLNPETTGNTCPSISRKYLDSSFLADA
jgi:hypothetical protein